MRHRLLTAAAGVLMLTFWAAPAQAEIIVLVSGRSVSVKTHRVEGDKIILTLRSGGEVTFLSVSSTRSFQMKCRIPSRLQRPRRSVGKTRPLRRASSSRRPTAKSSRPCPKRTASIRCWCAPSSRWSPTTRRRPGPARAPGLRLVVGLHLDEGAHQQRMDACASDMAEMISP